MLHFTINYILITNHILFLYSIIYNDYFYVVVLVVLDSIQCLIVYVQSDVVYIFVRYPLGLSCVWWYQLGYLITLCKMKYILKVRNYVVLVIDEIHITSIIIALSRMGLWYTKYLFRILLLVFDNNPT